MHASFTDGLPVDGLSDQQCTYWPEDVSSASPSPVSLYSHSHSQSQHSQHSQHSQSPSQQGPYLSHQVPATASTSSLQTPLPQQQRFPSQELPSSLISGLSGLSCAPRHTPHHQIGSWTSPVAATERELSGNYSLQGAGAQSGYQAPISPVSWPSPGRPLQTPEMQQSQLPLRSTGIYTPTQDATQLAAYSPPAMSRGYVQSSYPPFPKDTTTSPRIPSLDTASPARNIPQQQQSLPPMPGLEPTSQSAQQQHADSDDEDEEMSSPQSASEAEDAPEGSEGREGGGRLSGPYAQLLYKALIGAPDYAMALQGIYNWFLENTDKTPENARAWQSSIRHNLSQNHGFYIKGAGAGEGEETAHLPKTKSNVSKRSNVWALTVEAVQNGIQSTAQYRPKKDTGHASGRARGRAAKGGYRVGGAHASYHPYGGRRISSGRAHAGQKGGYATSRTRSQQSRLQGGGGQQLYHHHGLPAIVGQGYQTNHGASWSSSGLEMSQAPSMTPVGEFRPQPLTPERTPETFYASLPGPGTGLIHTPQAHQPHHGYLHHQPTAWPAGNTSCPEVQDMQMATTTMAEVFKPEPMTPEGTLEAFPDSTMAGLFEPGYQYHQLVDYSHGLAGVQGTSGAGPLFLEQDAGFRDLSDQQQ